MTSTSRFRRLKPPRLEARVDPVAHVGPVARAGHSGDLFEHFGVRVDAGERLSAIVAAQACPECGWLRRADAIEPGCPLCGTDRC